MRILIVDDHPFVRQGLIYVLNREMQDSLAVSEADSLSSALSLLNSNDYDLVLLDVSLEESSGLDVLAWIKNERSSLPVLIISMHPEDQYALRAIRLGASGYLSKHSAPSDLMTAIEQIKTNGKYISPKLSLLLANELGKRNHCSSDLHELLSNREMEIGCMIACGSTAKEIANKLCLSVKTVNTYRTRLLQKLDIRSNVDLTAYFLRNKLIS